MLFQTCMSFFLLLSTKEGILKNVGHQTVDGALTLILSENIMEVNDYHQLFWTSGGWVSKSWHLLLLKIIYLYIFYPSKLFKIFKPLEIVI